MPEIDPHLAARIDRDDDAGGGVLLHGGSRSAIERSHGVVVERKTIESELRRADRAVGGVEEHALARGDRNRAGGAGIVDRVLSGMPFFTYSARPTTLSALAVVVVAEAGTALPAALSATIPPR